MNLIVEHSVAGFTSAQWAYAAMAAAATSAVSLAILHVISPEFSPSWRMVSEYANGKYAWLLTVVFLAWAVTSLCLLAALWPLSSSLLGKIGLLMLILAAVGQTMGGLFDINHKLHGPAAMIGIPSLCIAAVLLTTATRSIAPANGPPLWAAQLPWLSFAAMIIAMILFMSSLKAAGVDMSGQSKPLDALPTGVSAYIGWANRLIFIASYLWIVTTSLWLINLTEKSQGA